MKYLAVSILLLHPQTAFALQYELIKTYTAENLFDEFKFFSGQDPTGGFVQFTPFEKSAATGLIGNATGQVYLGVDTTNVYPPGGPGRPSVRLESKLTFSEGLFVLDLSHLPVGCGTWPAFWTVGLGDWPADGEIDIIEGVNDATHNDASLHVAGDCTVSDTVAQTGTWKDTNCNVEHDGNMGCGTKFSDANSLGEAFNQNGGGVYAMEWTSSTVNVWFFPPTFVPASLSTLASFDPSISHPDPSTFGIPSASFSGPCSSSFGEKLFNHTIVIDTTFCGGWAGGSFGKGATKCPTLSGASSVESCVDFVGNHPEAFAEAYWLLNNLRVWQRVPGIETSYLANQSTLTTIAESVEAGEEEEEEEDIKVSPLTGGVLTSSDPLLRPLGPIPIQPVIGDDSVLELVDLIPDEIPKGPWELSFLSPLIPDDLAAEPIRAVTMVLDAVAEILPLPVPEIMQGLPPTTLLGLLDSSAREKFLSLASSLLSNASPNTPLSKRRLLSVLTGPDPTAFALLQPSLAYSRILVSPAASAVLAIDALPVPPLDLGLPRSLPTASLAELPLGAALEDITPVPPANPVALLNLLPQAPVENSVLDSEDTSQSVGKILGLLDDTTTAQLLGALAQAVGIPPESLGLAVPTTELLQSITPDITPAIEPGVDNDTTSHESFESPPLWEESSVMEHHVSHEFEALAPPPVEIEKRHANGELPDDSNVLPLAEEALKLIVQLDDEEIDIVTCTELIAALYVKRRNFNLPILISYEDEDGDEGEQGVVDCHNEILRRAIAPKLNSRQIKSSPAPTDPSASRPSTKSGKTRAKTSKKRPSFRTGADPLDGLQEADLSSFYGGLADLRSTDLRDILETHFRNYNGKIPAHADENADEAENAAEYLDEIEHVNSKIKTNPLRAGKKFGTPVVGVGSIVTTEDTPDILSVAAGVRLLPEVDAKKVNVVTGPRVEPGNNESWRVRWGLRNMKKHRKGKRGRKTGNKFIDAVTLSPAEWDEVLGTACDGVDSATSWSRVCNGAGTVTEERTSDGLAGSSVPVSYSEVET